MNIARLEKVQEIATTKTQDKAVVSLMARIANDEFGSSEIVIAMVNDSLDLVHSFKHLARGATLISVRKNGIARIHQKGYLSYQVNPKLKLQSGWMSYLFPEDATIYEEVLNYTIKNNGLDAISVDDLRVKMTTKRRKIVKDDSGFNESLKRLRNAGLIAIGKLSTDPYFGVEYVLAMHAERFDSNDVVEYQKTPWTQPTVLTVPVLNSLKGENQMAKVSKAKVSKKVSKKATSKVAKKATGVGRPIGKTTGEGVHGAWCHVFTQNEKVKVSQRKTDEEITKWMYKEFPGRETAAFKYVQSVRQKYNRGGLTNGQVPAKQSHRYDENGKLDDPGKKSSTPKASPKKKVSKKSSVKRKGATTRTKK